jgi:hypothetical protein
LESKFRSLESKSKKEPNEVIKVGTVVKEQKSHSETYSRSSKRASWRFSPSN